MNEIAYKSDYELPFYIVYILSVTFDDFLCPLMFQTCHKNHAMKFDLTYSTLSNLMLHLKQ